MQVASSDSRIESIDIARGLVMIIMALDHARDLLHVHALTQNPLDLSTASEILFFTRWITHLCAPTFVFLAGTSAYLFLQRSGWPKTRRYLLSRGLLLILLEFTGVNFVMWFDFQFRTLLFEVIAAIGFGYIILGLLLRLPDRYLALFGFLIVCFQGFILEIPFTEGSIVKSFVNAIFSITVIPVSSQSMFGIVYPPLPWLSVLLLGFAAGRLFKEPVLSRKCKLTTIGVAALLLFVLIRSISSYGDIPWAKQKDNLYTFLSFINVSKYPPSSLFILLMLGLTCIILALSENAGGKVSKILRVYGQTPLFYFIIHFAILHTIMLITMILEGYHFSDLNFGSFNPGRPKGESGIELRAVYIVWISVVIAMYPLCKWYGRYKVKNSENRFLRFL